MNVLMLLAGPSDDFFAAGYRYPKSLIEVDGIPVIERVVTAYRPLIDRAEKLVAIVLKDDNRRFHVGSVIKLLVSSSVVLEAQNQTGGAACTALLAIDQLDPEQPLIVCNGDQVIDTDLGPVVADFERRGLSGGILVFPGLHPRWSFVRCDEQGRVIETAEKRPISRLATAGFYYFSKARHFIESAKATIRNDAHTEGAFYVSSCFNEMILQQLEVGIFQIPAAEYRSLATPALLESFERHLMQQQTKRGDLA